MPANLKPGLVRIISLADGEPRLGMEHTKPVFQPVIINGPPTVFVLEPTDGHDNYKISIGQYPFTGIRDDVLIATIESEQDQVWKITYRENQDAYTIEVRGESQGWTIPSKHGDVKISPIVSTKSIPPQFLHTQLFRFEVDG